MISQNAKCRYCSHPKAWHHKANGPDRQQCSGSIAQENGRQCACAEFEVQVSDTVYAAARALQERLDAL